MNENDFSAAFDAEDAFVSRWIICEEKEEEEEEEEEEE